LGSHGNSVIDVNFVSDNYSHQRTALVVLLDSLEPLSKQMECVWISNVIHQHDQVCLAEKFKCDLLEDVLPCNINQVKLYTIVRLALNRDLFDIVFAALSHHVVMVKALFADLVHQACLANSWFSCNNHTCSQDRHFIYYLISNFKCS
jgi:hypothetical protein